MRVTGLSSVTCNQKLLIHRFAIARILFDEVFDAIHIKPEDRDLTHSLITEEGRALNRLVKIKATGHEVGYVKK